MNDTSEIVGELGTDKFCTAVSEVLKVRADTHSDIEALKVRFASAVASPPKGLNEEAVAILAFAYETIGDDVLLSLINEARDQEVLKWFRNRGLALELFRRLSVCSRSKLITERVGALGGEERFDAVSQEVNDLTLVQAAELVVHLEAKRWLLRHQQESELSSAQSTPGIWFKRTYLPKGPDGDGWPVLKLEYPNVDGDTSWALWSAYGPPNQS
jgi:hypothetical protein